MVLKRWSLFAAILVVPTLAFSDGDVGQDLARYRELVNEIRVAGAFQTPLTVGGSVRITYRMRRKGPVLAQPEHEDVPLHPDSERFIRRFWDSVFLEKDSRLYVGDQELPLSCLFVSGVDNRYSGKDSPLVPDLALRVYLVVNDFSCRMGPYNPNWPVHSDQKEIWKTYLSYKVKDPTLMLPTEAKLRYLESDTPVVFVDAEKPTP